MKKFLSLLVIAVMLFTVACAETEDMREFYNPENYELLFVTDAWIDDAGVCIVQGCFGNIEGTEIEPEMVGFDAEQIFSLAVAEDAVIEMPESINDVENVAASCEDLVAYADALREEFNDISFYCTFELDEEGILTRLSYCYMP